MYIRAIKQAQAAPVQSVCMGTGTVSLFNVTFEGAIQCISVTQINRSILLLLQSSSIFHLYVNGGYGIAGVSNATLALGFVLLWN